MKLSDIYEMTMRSGVKMDDMVFPDFENYQLTLEGKMQHGYEVYSFKFNDTVLYGVKVGKEFASFVQIKMTTIPKIGQVAETLNSKTKKPYSKQLLSYKLRYFLNKHLGLSILLGKVHSIATETVLPKITKLFDVFMVNTKTGEIVPWSVESYQNLTHIAKVTDWQVLLKGNSEHPLGEQKELFVDWSLEKNRHMWTFGDYFTDLDDMIDIFE